MAASTLALFDYLRKSRSKGFVLSLSGGADSSTIAILVAEMVKRGVEMLGIPLFLKKSIEKETSVQAAVFKKLQVKFSPLPIREQRTHLLPP